MKNQVLLVATLFCAFECFAQTQLYGPTSMGPNGLTAQDFETTYNQYDAQGADDFIVPTGETWLIDSFLIMGQYSATASTNSGLNIEVFTDNNGEPGTSVFQQNTNADVDFNGDGDLLAFFDPPLSLTTGHYWIVVNARKDFAGGSSTGQWYWTRDSANTGLPALWKNPGNGFLTTCTSWIEIYNCDSLNMPDSGYAFFIYGCNNPPRPSLSFNSDDTTLCNGESLTLTATTNANPANYEWNTGDSSQSIVITEAGEYKITVSDGIGTCDSRKSINVSFIDIQQPSAGDDDSICAGADPALFLTSQPTCPDCRIVWPDNSSTGFYYASTEGWVVVTYLDTIHGCAKSDSAYLTVHPSETTILPDSTIHFCAGEKVKLSTLETLTNVFWLRSSNGVTWSLLGQDSVVNAATAGMVSVEGITEFGCTATDTAILISHPVPYPSLSYTTMIDGTVDITVTQVDSGSTYAWNNGKKTKTITVEENKNYTVTVTSIWGCEGVQSILITTVGLSDISKTTLRIFPNPAKDLIYIQLPDETKPQSLLHITDVGGRVYDRTLSYPQGPNLELDVSGLPSGMYMIHMVTENGNEMTGSFVISN